MSVKIKLDEKAIKKIFQDVLFDSVLKLHALVIQHAPSGATNELRQKIDFFPKQWGFYEYKVISQSSYSAAVEYGTKPHVVSARHLMDWARLKLGDEKAAWPVAMKIKKFGTDARPFMYPAYLEVREIWVKQFLKQEFSKLGLNI